MTRVTRRLDPPLAADEATTLLAFLDYHRDTLRRKTEGLTQEQLAMTLAPATLTLGGLLKHMALVESSWFSEVFLGEPMMEPFASADWESDRDWEFTSAPQDSPGELRSLFDRAVARSDDVIRVALDLGGLDGLSAKESRRAQQPYSLRWILVHMIEEYARHNGHADLIRESIDGVTGE
ncbi:DinB family protein [Nocardioides sp.]|uniref:DinB family protein n=1 Tax=Nocardioides sp. TaxID=35761 RepID=UPI003D0BD487